MSQRLRQDILELLSRSKDYISGQDLSANLGVSRTSIWKHIQKLRQMGYEIESISNVGYRLINPTDQLIPEEIQRNLRTDFLGRKVIYYKEVDSTNNQAKLHAFEYPEGTIFLAESQTSGRGRLGRLWYSKPGKGIWCSILLKPDLKPVEASQFPLITAVAITETLMEIGMNAEIKWPNDILYKGKKLCGILTEIGAELDRLNYLIVGFGLNVKHSIDDLPLEIKDTATSVEMVLSRDISRVQILKEILYQLEKRYLQFMREGFDPILKLWKKYNCTLGKRITVSRFNQLPLAGEAVDINIDGSLLFKKEDGQLVSIFSGEIENQ